MNVIDVVLKLGRPFKAVSRQKIFAQGKPARLLFYLSSGRFITRASSANGREVIVTDFQFGQFLPITALIEGAIYGADGIAQSDCEMMAIETAKLRKLLIQNSHVSYDFLQLALRRLQRRTGQFIDLALLNATGRIARRLLEMAHQQNTRLHDGIVIQFEGSTRAVGLTVGMSRETVSRQLGWLTRQGIINSSRKTVTLLDITQLQALSNVNATSK